MAQVELLDAKRHDRAGFSCSEPSLDSYLRQQATQHQRNGIATTHVLVDALHERAAGFYLAYGFRAVGGGSLSLYLPLGKS